MTGFVYKSPWVYEAFMRVLYRQEFSLRYEAVARAIDGCESVVDVCCGPGLLERWLDPAIRYRGMDCNPRFVRRAARRGADVIQGDVREAEIPQADAVVMVSSLYQFLGEHEALIERMIDACRRRVVIAEPIQHTSHANWLLTKIAGLLLDPGVPYSHDRFDREAMTTCFRKIGFSRIEPVGTRELMGVFEKDRPDGLRQALSTND